MAAGRLPHVLISNDDGVGAPGLVAVAHALAACDWCKVSICGPAEEKSAQSHALSLTKVVVATAIPKVADNIIDAFAVHGTPADAVMLALNSPILSDPVVDLVFSGINRGENCGLHVVYSGTVGAAREAAIKGVRAIAVSLDNYAARDVEHYEAAAQHCLPLVQAMLGLLGPPASPSIAGFVLNINCPGGAPYRGYAWARQGGSCTSSTFRELPAAVEAATTVAGGPTGTSMDVQVASAVPGTREFLRGIVPVTELQHGTDLAAVRGGYVSATPLGLLQHLHSAGQPAADAMDAMAAIVTAAGAHAGLPVIGL